jgi:hypothetical protein
MKVWKLKATDAGETQPWQTFQIGGDEELAEMLAKAMQWKGEGQSVRLEWSEQN